MITQSEPDFFVRVRLPRDTSAPLVTALNDCKRFVFIGLDHIECDYTRWELALALELAQAWQAGLVRRRQRVSETHVEL